MMAAHFRTQQVKLGTDEIQYVNMSFDKLGRFGKLGLIVLRVELLSSIISRLTKNKHIGSHKELIYSQPRAGVDTGTLECDVMMREEVNGN